MIRGRVAWVRDLVISVLLAALVAGVQVLSHSPTSTVLLSAGIAFVVAMFVLIISDRYSRQG